MQKMLQFNQRSVLLGAEGGVSKGRGKYGKMENELKRSNQDYIDSTVQEQQQIMREQDQDLEKVSAGLVTLDHMAHAIGEETEDQNRILGDMAHDIEETDSRLQALVNRVQLATRKAGDKCQIVTIIILILILIVIIGCFFI